MPELEAGVVYRKGPLSCRRRHEWDEEIVVEPRERLEFQRVQIDLVVGPEVLDMQPCSIRRRVQCDFDHRKLTLHDETVQLAISSLDEERQVDDGRVPIDEHDLLLSDAPAFVPSQHVVTLGGESAKVA